MAFDNVEYILGFQIDHSFLICKKELSVFGFKVVKISMKEQTEAFEKIK